jgi:hypothetical protein
MYNPFSPFAPTVEKVGPSLFLSKHPTVHLLEKDVEDVPWITSVRTEDGLVISIYNKKYQRNFLPRDQEDR